jgi:hypothetical protein
MCLENIIMVYMCDFLAERFFGVLVLSVFRVKGSSIFGSNLAKSLGKCSTVTRPL